MTPTSPTGAFGQQQTRFQGAQSSPGHPSVSDGIMQMPNEPEQQLASISPLTQAAAGTEPNLPTGQSQSPPALHSSLSAALSIQSATSRDSQSHMTTYTGSTDPNTGQDLLLGHQMQTPSNDPVLTQPNSDEGTSRSSGTVSAPLFLMDQEIPLSPAQNGGQGSKPDVPCYYLTLEQQEKDRVAAETAGNKAARHLQGAQSLQPVHGSQEQQQQQEMHSSGDGMLSFATKEMDVQDMSQLRPGPDSVMQEGHMGRCTSMPQVHQPLHEQQQQQQRYNTLQQHQQQQLSSPATLSLGPPWEYSGTRLAQNERSSSNSITSKDQQGARLDTSTGTGTEGGSGSGTTPNSGFEQRGFDLSSSLSGHSTETGSTPAPRSSASGSTAWPSNIPGMEALMAANVRSTGRLESASSNSSEQLVALHKFLQFARIEQQQQGNTRAVQTSYANETMHQPYPLEGQGPLPLGHQAAIQKAADLLRQRLPPNLPISRTGSLDSRQHASSQPTLGANSQLLLQPGGLDSLPIGPLRATGPAQQSLVRQQPGVTLQGMRSGQNLGSEYEGSPRHDNRGAQASSTSILVESRDDYAHRAAAAAYTAAMTGQEQALPLQHHQRVSSSPGLGDLLARAQHLAAFGGGHQQGGEPRQVWHGGPGAPPMEGGAGRVNDSGRLMYGEVGEDLASGSGTMMEPPEGKPSRHLWLGNIPVKPNKAALEELFGFFGPLESVRVFPEKTFAFVNYVSAVHAATAKAQLDGLPAGSVTGGKPLVIRFQRDILILPGMGLGHGAADGGGYAGVGSPRIPRPPGFRSAPDAGEDAGYEPATNLSNRLNPNNIHFDAELANRYKRMSKSEKELLWAQDWALQQLLAHPSSLGGTNTILDISSATLLLAASGAALPSGLAQDPQGMHPGAYHPSNLSASAAAAAALLTQGVGAGLGQQGRLRALQQQGAGPLQQTAPRSMFTPPFLSNQPHSLARQHSSGPVGRHAHDLTMGSFGGSGTGGGVSRERQAQMDQQMLMDMQLHIAGLNMQTGSETIVPMDSSSMAGNTSVRANLRLAGQVSGGSDHHHQQQQQQQQQLNQQQQAMFQSSPSMLQQRQMPPTLQQFQDPVLEQQWQMAMNRSARPPPPQAYTQGMGQDGRQHGFLPQGPETEYIGGGQQVQGVDGNLWAQMLASIPPEAVEGKRQMQVASDGGPSSASSMSHVQRYIHLEHQLQERQQQNVRQQQQLQQQSHHHMQQQLQQQQWGMQVPSPPHFAQVVQQQLSQLQQQRWLTKPIPPTFLCPLTWELMADPVVAADGITYDRANIMGWFRDHNASPVTNQPLANKSLTVNQALQSAIIDELVSRQQQQQPRAGNTSLASGSSNAPRQ